MDAEELAGKMIEWAKLKRQLDELGKEIEEVVFDLGKTQTVGHCRVTYSKGRRRFDHRKAVGDAILAETISDDDVILFESVETVVSVDWCGICEEYGIEVVPTPGKPSAKIKLLA